MATGERTTGEVCPRCAKQQRVPLAAVGHECERCLWEWRFAICHTCHAFLGVLEYLESWQCQKCSTFNRSWWKTADAERETMVVAERRRADHVTHPGRWVAAGAGAFVFVVASVWFVVPRDSSEDREKAATKAACRRFDALRREQASGTLARADLLGELDAVVTEAAEAPTAVRDSAARAAAEATAGTDSPAFDAAMTSLGDACRASSSSAG